MRSVLGKYWSHSFLLLFFASFLQFLIVSKNLIKAIFTVETSTQLQNCSKRCQRNWFFHILSMGGQWPPLPLIYTIMQLFVANVNLGFIKLPDIMKFYTCQLFSDYIVDGEPSNFTLNLVP